METEAYEPQSRRVDADEMSNGAGDARRTRLLKAIADTKAKIGDVDLYHLETTDHDILFVCPDEHQFAECTGKSAENRKRAPEAMKQLAYQIVKYPDLEIFRVLAKRRPGIPAKLANDAVAIAADEMAEFAKKV